MHDGAHGAAFYTLNGKNVNVMLEFKFQHDVNTFPIERIGNGAVWKFVIYHVANVKVFNFPSWWRRMETCASIDVRFKIIRRKKRRNILAIILESK